MQKLSQILVLILLSSVFHEYPSVIFNGKHDDGKSIDDEFYEHKETEVLNTMKSNDTKRWPNHPLYIYAAYPHVKTMHYEPFESLPLEVPIEFESALFKGRLLIRLREGNNKSSSYFQSNEHLWQYIVQGQFKRKLALLDIMSGDYYERPFKGFPTNGIGKVVMDIYKKGMEALFPGCIMDMASPRPKMLQPFATFKKICIDLQGEEDVLSSTTYSVKENMLLMFGAMDSPRTSDERKQFLSKPKVSSKYMVDPDHVYTFEMYDEKLDFNTYTQNSGMFKVDMCEMMDKQPLSFSLFNTKDESIIFKFPILHERLVKKSC